MGVEINRFAVVLVALDPTLGHEIKKTRPCLVISPDEMNRHLATVLVAPMTTKGKAYPTRIPCTFQSTKGYVVLDQLRTIDKARILKPIGKINARAREKVLHVLNELFAP